jgi:hypothetical protein
MPGRANCFPFPNKILAARRGVIYLAGTVFCVPGSIAVFTCFGEAVGAKSNCPIIALAVYFDM